MPSRGAMPGNTLGLAPGTHVRLFDAYVEARESMDTMDAEEAIAVSDFPTYISKFIRHTFLERFNEIQGSWGQYTRDFSLEDFELYTSSRFGRFDDIPQKSLGGEYDQLSLREFPGESLQLKEFGAAIVVTRELIIADRLNKISELPRLAAEALARTMSKDAAVNQFQSNPTMYDGNALFSAAHANLLAATALTANDTGMGLLQAAELKLDSQTDDEGYKIQTPGAPYTLIIPIDYRWIAKALNDNQLILNAAATQLVANLVQGRYTILEERFFTDTNNYYMASDLKGTLGFLAHVTLNGQSTPFIGLKDPGVRGVLGGDDPYSFDFDEIAWKLRHDFAFKPVEWRGIVGAIV